MKKIALVLVVASLPFNSYASSCANKDEVSAFNLRALQSSMMVAALSCGQQKQYNKFMGKYQDNLSSGGSSIKAYFKRSYGSNYEYELNKFITKLANNATKLSMESNEEIYCDQTQSAFNDLLRTKVKSLDKYISNRKYTALHGVKSCS